MTATFEAIAADIGRRFDALRQEMRKADTRDLAAASAHRDAAYRLARELRRRVAEPVADVARRRIETITKLGAVRGKPGPKPGRKLPPPPPLGRKGSGRFMPRYVTEKVR